LSSANRPALVVLVGEGLDDADAADILLDPGVEVADAAEQLCQFAVIRPP
jgi:fatty acid/phospholipid biosynthesis enzyme